MSKESQWLFHEFFSQPFMWYNQITGTYSYREILKNNSLEILIMKKELKKTKDAQEIQATQSGETLD